MIKKSRIAVLLLVSVLAASLAISLVSACATLTPGYWKNHPEAWVVRPITVAGWGFSENWIIPANAMDILNTPVRGDARVNLQQKVIAAELSIMSDKDLGWNFPSEYQGGPMPGVTVPQLIDSSIALLAANAGPWTPNSAADTSGVRAQGLALAGAIDYWLNFYDIG